MKQLFIVSLLVFTSILFNSRAVAADVKDEAPETKDTEITQILNSVGYPELQVVPRASERLRIEAKAERGNWSYAHWPIELSGLTTLFVGVTAKSNRRNNLTEHEKGNATSLASAATAVGAGWIIGGLILGADKPYADGYRSLSSKADDKKDERGALLRERLAEEALERPARNMRVLQWASVITNAGASALVGNYGNDKGKVIAGVGVLLAFLPIMFNDHAIDVYEKHIEYKKKIYAPIRTGSFHYDPTSKTLTPMQNLVWNF